LLGADVAQSASDSLDQVLRAWISQNISFVKDRENRDTLFIRKRPVRAHVRSDDPEINTQARGAISNLADAFGLEHTFTTDRMNLFVATAEGIAGSAKPSKRVLSGLGLPSSAVDQIVNVVSD